MTSTFVRGFRSFVAERGRAPARTFPRAMAVLVLLVVFVTSCGSGGGDLPQQVVDDLNIPKNAVSDLTAVGSETVPRIDLLQTALRASNAGANLRIVIAGADDPLVSAEAVVDAYGGTALSYKANDSTFEAASKEISREQLDRALVAAGQQADMGESAAAFVDVLEREGVEAPGASIGRWLLILVLIAAAMFMVAQAMAFWSARKRRVRRQKEFAERKAVLRDWAAQLRPQVEEISTVIDPQNESAQMTLAETRSFASSIVDKIDGARTLGELDQAEMRVGRAAIRLRELRKTAVR